MQTREERDAMGIVHVPETVLWGAQTQRSLDNFKISGELMPATLIHALAQVKLVGWGEARTPTSTKSPIVGFHCIQPNLRVVAIENDAMFGGGVAF